MIERKPQQPMLSVRDKDLYEQVVRIARAEDLKVAQVLRRAVRLYVQGRQKAGRDSAPPAR